MDCRLQEKIKVTAEALAREHQQELAVAGTLVDLEELACQIGDEIARSLTEGELVRRSQEQPRQEAKCPDCGRACLPDDDPEPIILAGMRGELAFSQPKHYCDRCRRSFFPDGCAIGAAGQKHCDNESAPEGGVGRSQ